MNGIESKIEIMQTNLRSLRSCAGWSQEQLGKMLGISKQQISNLECGRTKLLQPQYIAIRALLDYVKADRPILSFAIDTYFGSGNWKDEIFGLLKGEKHGDN